MCRQNMNIVIGVTQRVCSTALETSNISCEHEQNKGIITTNDANEQSTNVQWHLNVHQSF
jgi:hypothetical protein